MIKINTIQTFNLIQNNKENKMNDAKKNKELNKKQKSLIIVESPAKAKTIKNFLGQDYEVIASKGHIRDLSKKKLGITIENNIFTPTYELSADHKDIVEKIKQAHSNASTTFIATDEDREGEAIGFHIVQALKGKVETFPRIVFHEITKNAITESLKNARTIDMDKVNAQQTRRLLDRIVGFKLSPLISTKIRSGLSAGRVQSSTLKILVDKEKEITKFIPQDYYMFNAEEKKGDGYIFDLVSYQNKKIDKLSILDKDEADNILKELKKDGFIIKSIEKKSKTIKSPPPFMTSTLQQSASSMLGYSPTRTMSIAQKLYEGVNTDEGLRGVITYMRTDSLNISKEAISGVRDYILKNLGEQYLPKNAKKYLQKNASAQEAHEAIRPTSIDFTPEIAKGYLKEEELKLYTIIFNRFLASQINDAIFDTISVQASGNNTKGIFKINGRQLIFDGFYKVLGNDDKDKLLKEYKEGEKILFQAINQDKKTTEPPNRFSEASLIKKMEELGIGRPSTYAPTIKLLTDRKYIEIDKRQIKVLDIATTVIELLQAHFNNIVDSNFSAELESKLDLIANKEKDWQKVLWEFYEPFNQKILEGKSTIQSQKVLVPTGEKCPDCGHELIKRMGRFGEFISCSNYPKCKYIKKEKKEVEIEKSDEKCEKCGGDMIYKTGRNGKFLACSNYPKCKNAKSINAEKITVPCPKCKGEIVLKKTKKGAFYGCSNYPSCDFISKYKPIDKHCDKCDYLMHMHAKKEGIAVCIACKNESEI